MTTHKREVRREALRIAITSKTAPILRTKNMAVVSDKPPLDAELTVRQVGELLKFLDIELPQGTNAGNLNAVLDHVLETLKNVDGEPSESPMTDPQVVNPQDLSLRRTTRSARMSDREVAAKLAEKGLKPVS